MKPFPDDLSRAFGRADREFAACVQRSLDELKLPVRKGRYVMKRKLSLGLVLILILLLLAMGTAIALTLSWSHIEEAMDLAVESGAYWEWSLDAKAKLIRAMREDGVDVSEKDWKDLTGNELTENDKQALADRILTEKYGEKDYIYYYTIAVAEWGEPQTWTLEQRHWFFSKQREKGLYLDDSWIDVLPDENDISRDRAIEIARRAVREAYGLADGEIEAYYPNVSFFITDVCDTPRWNVEFLRQDESGRLFGAKYNVLLTRKGEVTEDWEDLGILTPAHAREKEARDKENQVDDFALRGEKKLNDLEGAYYNPAGGIYYHFVQDCPMVKEEYLPLAEIAKADPGFARLSPCPCCVQHQDFWTLEDKVKYKAGRWKAPEEDWIPESEAKELARQALLSSGVSSGALRETYPAVYTTAENDRDALYLIYFERVDVSPDGAVNMSAAYFVLIDPVSGELNSCGEAGENG